jgi:thiosulfate/3-mercaptopyruvate sulfurtransferase
MSPVIENAVKTGLITPADLAGILGEPGTMPVTLLDASYGSGYGGHAPKAVFEAFRIGDAQYFDIDQVADPEAPFAHTIPSASLFEQAVGKLGIGNDHLVVIYDQTGVAMAAARAWWMFRVFGHTKVCVLDGGLPAWHQAGFEVNQEPPKTPIPQAFSASSANNYISSYEQILGASQTTDAIIVDVRPSLAAGQIPSSHHLPAGLLIDPATRGLASYESLQDTLAPLNLQADTRIISSCNSGVMACVMALALHRTGHHNFSVYDGSWVEWAQKEFPS